MAINPRNFVSRGVYHGGVPGFASWGILLIGGVPALIPVIVGSLRVAVYSLILKVVPSARQLLATPEV